MKGKELIKSWKEYGYDENQIDDMLIALYYTSDELIEGGDLQDLTNKEIAEVQRELKKEIVQAFERKAKVVKSALS